jgi:hypothetical protein
MNGERPKIEIFEPFGAAFGMMKRILFRPFDYPNGLPPGSSGPNPQELPVDHTIDSFSVVKRIGIAIAILIARTAGHFQGGTLPRPKRRKAALIAQRYLLRNFR